MKTILVALLLIICTDSVNAQQPVIDGDLMLCPDSNGTAAVNNGAYDSYQWYYKYWFTSDPYVAIDGATAPVFTYDWYTYDQALLKVIATLDGIPYESNVLQIDSYAWLPIYVSYELGDYAQYYPESETISLCAGESFTVSINNPPYDTNVQWTLNGVALPDATSSTLVVTEPGTYQGSAAPGFCPDNPSTTLPITVTINNDCNLAVPQQERRAVIYPNPADHAISIIAPDAIDSYDIVDLTGKIIQYGMMPADKTIAIDDIAAGIYVLRLSSSVRNSIHKIIIK